MVVWKLRSAIIIMTISMCPGELNETNSFV